MTPALSGQAPQAVSLVPLYLVIGYLGALVVLGLCAKLAFRGTSSDYFLAGRSIGPFLMLMSLFGTTTTAFSMVGSTAEAYDTGIGVFGLMASSSGLVHPLMFFLVGIKLWAIGKRYDYVTQVQFFRARFQSDLLGYLLFPILVSLVVIYLLIGHRRGGHDPGRVDGGHVPRALPRRVRCGRREASPRRRRPAVALGSGDRPPWCCSTSSTAACAARSGPTRC